MRLPTVETLVIESAQTDDRLEVSVAVPSGPSAAGRPLPVIYVLDPVLNFETATAAAGWLATAGQLAGGDFPRTIVVGVGYPNDDDVRKVMARRARDLTPTDGPAPEGLSLPPFPFGLGGAARFLDALVSEVMPQIEAAYGADPDDRTLVGHSFGGLFALFTLFRVPAAFRRYLIISPSIWWDARVILRHEANWAAHHHNLPASVFIAVGRNEQAPGGGWKNEGFPDEAIAAIRQLDNYRELCVRLHARRYPDLNLECAVFDGEYHLTITAAAITRGLISLFTADNRRAHNEPSTGAPAPA